MKKILVFSGLILFINGCSTTSSPTCKENILLGKKSEKSALVSAKKFHKLGDTVSEKYMLETAKNMHEATELLKDSCKD